MQHLDPPAAAVCQTAAAVRQLTASPVRQPTVATAACAIFLRFNNSHPRDPQMSRPLPVAIENRQAVSNMQHLLVTIDNIQYLFYHLFYMAYGIMVLKCVG